MELSSQIKKYRKEMDLSQEDLAEKLYVSRQTISNWENEKNYPDIHSLLDLSSLFGISLDQLIKGDIEKMREEVNQANQAERKEFDRNGKILACLMVLMVASGVPLGVFLGYKGLIVFGGIFAVAMYYAVKVERYKKKYDIQTYREIVAFTEGKLLDEIEKARESGKRPYQKVLMPIACGAVALVVSILLLWLFNLFL